MSAVVTKSIFSVSFSKDDANKPGVALGLLLSLMLAFSMFGASSAHAAPKYAGIVVDAKTGKVLYGDDPDGLRYPASLTKMMTLYLTFEALEAGRISLKTSIPVSANAAAEPPSKLGVRKGSSINVDQAIRSLVTRSANDVSTALGEFLGGSEGRFAQMMTNKARALGMTRTTYRNAHGLPNTAQMTTARDQARLGIALRQHFPQYYHYFGIRSFKYGKQTIGNHNRLVGTVKGVDGIKTGYTRASGSNLATSAELNGRSIVAVVLGGRSSRSRDAQMRKLVATYLPKASRGGTSNLIAQVDIATPPMPVAPPRNAAAARHIAALDLPDSGPTPDSRYTTNAIAATAPSASSYAGESASSKAASRALDSAMTGVPTPAPEFVPARSEKVSKRRGKGSIDDVTTSSTKASSTTGRKSEMPSGWVIQIGTSPSEKMAKDLLQNAQDKGGKVLRSATPFTVAFNNKGEQVYRARFGGFGDQKRAVDACSLLKKKGVNCWASLQ